MEDYSNFPSKIVEKGLPDFSVKIFIMREDNIIT
jgi:hypothetical protein